ncbi:Rne/Rng family ribonuclease [candidate division KSB1 bacterium]|nr:Rne/Rng family ribonuclease [candidate division KSB1 bacterium]
MMKKDIIINYAISETRIAILENKKLVELFVERPENERTVGDIYLGRVVNVVKGIRAAFVDIGQNQDAFLHFSDVGDTFTTVNSLVDLTNAQYRPDNIPVEDIKEGQELLVQIIKEPISTKGSRITTQISIPGRFCVLVPNSNMVGVSRKLESVRERRRLKKLARRLKPANFGLIIRTVAEGKQLEQLEQDVQSLMKMWDKIERKMKKHQPPMIIYKDMRMTSGVIRDLFTNDISRVVVDSKKLHRDITIYVKDVAPTLVDKIELFQKDAPIFDTFQIESEIEKSLSRKVWMKSGGYLIFDHTEALVAIDVNSGKFVGRKGHDENSLRVNLEAAKEIARQLRLRDIGGIIVIDFIDMIDPRNRQKLHEEFKKELRKDRAQANITPISEFGLIEMTRERVRPSLLFTFSETCPTCDGTGRVTSKGTVLTHIERWVRRFKASTRERRLVLSVNPEISKYLREGVKSRIRRIMWKFWVKIDVIADESLAVTQFKFYSKKRNIDVTDQFMS